MSATTGMLAARVIALHRLGRVLVRAGDAHDVGAGFLDGADLVDGRAASPVMVLVIVCTEIGASPPTGDLADHDLARLAPVNVAIGAKTHWPGPPFERSTIDCGSSDSASAIARSLPGIAHRLAVEIDFHRAGVRRRQRQADDVGHLVGVARLQRAVDVDHAVLALHEDARRLMHAQHDAGAAVLLAIDLAWRQRRGGCRRTAGAGRAGGVAGGCGSVS